LRKVDPFDLEDIKVRLKEMRKKSIGNIDVLVNQAIENLNKHPNVKAYYAQKSENAVKQILDSAEDINSLAYNNSSTVAELILELVRQKQMKLIDSYSNDLRLEQEDFLRDDISGFWDLPDPEPALVWHSFVDSRRSAAPFMAAPLSYEPFIGMLGANVISSEGGIFFVQHLRNIAKILSQAEKIFVIAGIDKLVPTNGEALFQARCCATFGYESILSDMFNVSEEEGEKKEDQPAGEDEKKIWYNLIDPSEVHVILLDNGRKNIMASEFSELFYCIGCRACTLRCPRAKSSSEGYRSAKDLLFSGFTHGIEHAAEYGLFNCTLCKGCESACPVDIPLASYLSKMRENAISKGLMPETYSRLSSNVREFGTPYGKKGLEAQRTGGGQ
jgi:L-lactate utilization protein LutB